MNKLSIEEAKEKLLSYRQEHLLSYYPELNSSEQEALLDQIAETDFSYLGHLPERNAPAARGAIQPLKALREKEIEEKREYYARIGLQALADGKAAAVCLAGGMGTRLGFDGPKGCYDIGVTHPVYIFERLISNLMVHVRECGRWPYLFIMTSEANDKASRQFLEEHHFFGYDSSHVLFFRQDMAPAVDEEGRIFLETRSSLATSPNGNGGWFRSLLRAGYGDLLRLEGIEYLNVFSVDNVLQDICDPVFLGAVLSGGYASGSKVVRKSDPYEKVGVMCLEDGRPSVIEYSEMSEDMLLETDDSGERVYDFGVILNYLFRVPDLLDAADAALPLHFAYKKIPHIGADGIQVVPDSPNGWKFEYFIFDILKSLKDCLPFEVRRESAFAPVKNRSGVDSVDTARALCLKNGIDL